jgi:hypothetical protein
VPLQHRTLTKDKIPLDLDTFRLPPKITTKYTILGASPHPTLDFTAHSRHLEGHITQEPRHIYCWTPSHRSSVLPSRGHYCLSLQLANGHRTIGCSIKHLGFNKTTTINQRYGYNNIVLRFFYVSFLFCLKNKDVFAVYS